MANGFGGGGNSKRGKSGIELEPDDAADGKNADEEDDDLPASGASQQNFQTGKDEDEGPVLDEDEPKGIVEVAEIGEEEQDADGDEDEGTDDAAATVVHSKFLEIGCWMKWEK